MISHVQAYFLFTRICLLESHIVSSSPVFPNLLKIAEHLTIKLLENPSYLKSNFIIQHNILWISNFSGSTTRLLVEHCTCGPWSSGREPLLQSMTFNLILSNELAQRKAMIASAKKIFSRFDQSENEALFLQFFFCSFHFFHF